jgi:hypothetical protein
MSSSAPMEAIASFFQYINAVALKLSYEKIGGSRACLKNIRQVHKHLADMPQLSNYCNDKIQQCIRK